jgi:hypothetical protein
VRLLLRVYGLILNSLLAYLAYTNGWVKLFGWITFCLGFAAGVSLVAWWQVRSYRRFTVELNALRERYLAMMKVKE